MANKMSDMDKVLKCFNEVGIEYTVEETYKDAHDRQWVQVLIAGDEDKLIEFCDGELASY